MLELEVAFCLPAMWLRIIRKDWEQCGQKWSFNLLAVGSCLVLIWTPAVPCQETPSKPLSVSFVSSVHSDIHLVAVWCNLLKVNFCSKGWCQRGICCRGDASVEVSSTVHIEDRWRRFVMICLIFSVYRCSRCLGQLLWGHGYGSSQQKDYSSSRCLDISICLDVFSGIGSSCGWSSLFVVCLRSYNGSRKDLVTSSR